MKRPKLKPGNDSLMELPFLSPDRADIPEFDEFFTGLDDVDDLLREVGNLPGPDDLVRETPSVEQDRATLLSPDEENVSRLLGTYAVQKPARRTRPRRRGKANHA